MKRGSAAYALSALIATSSVFYAAPVLACDEGSIPIESCKCDEYTGYCDCVTDCKSTAGSLGPLGVLLGITLLFYLAWKKLAGDPPPPKQLPASAITASSIQPLLL